MRRTGFWIAGLLFLALIAGGAFTGMRLLKAGDPSGLAGIGETVIGLDHAPEVPDAEPDLVGILTRRQDNSLFLGTGNIKFHSIRESDAEQPRFESGYDGPVVEVLVTHTTEIYYDVTEFDSPVGENGNVQQVVQTGPLEDLGENHLIQAWGERSGERLIARTLVIFSPPS